MSNNSNLEFRKIPSQKFQYEINENGTIFRNVKSKKQLKIKLDQHHSKTGYYVTFVHFGGRGPDSVIKRVMIHRVIAECWQGPCPDDCEVDHIDRNTHNNDFRNQRYVTKSEQMKNRDYTNIAKQGSENLAVARAERAKALYLCNDKEKIYCPSLADGARYLLEQYPESSFEKMRYKLRNHRSHIFDYDVIYLNAETKHGSSTEQEIVQEIDLTGDYKSAFNKGKQQETEMRVKHR